MRMGATAKRGGVCRLNGFMPHSVASSLTCLEIWLLQIRVARHVQSPRGMSSDKASMYDVIIAGGGPAGVTG